MREWLRRLLCRLGLCREPELHYIGGSDTLPPPLSRERETELLNRLGEEAARQELIEHNLRLVVYIARRFENTGINIEDLISIGTIGLIKAVGTYRTDKNIKLATYASRCIENEILMFLRKNAGRRVEVSFDEPLNTDYDGNELLLSDVLGTEADVVMRPSGGRCGPVPAGVGAGYPFTTGAGDHHSAVRLGRRERSRPRRRWPTGWGFLKATSPGWKSASSNG